MIGAVKTFVVIFEMRIVATKFATITHQRFFDFSSLDWMLKLSTNQLANDGKE